MHSRTVGFVGGGRITAILLEGLGGRDLALDRVTVSDTSAEVLAKLAVRFPAITTTADNSEAAGCERVFVALHPPALKAVLPELAPRVRRDAVVVSLAPVVTLAQLSQLLGGFTRLARVLPNAPSIVGAGFNPVAFADGLPAGARAEIEALLDRLGAHPVVPEDTLEAYAILAAMGPTYFWFQWQQLRDLAGTFGLRPATPTGRSAPCSTVRCVRSSTPASAPRRSWTSCRSSHSPRPSRRSSRSTGTCCRASTRSSSLLKRFIPPEPIGSTVGPKLAVTHVGWEIVPAVTAGATRGPGPRSGLRLVVEDQVAPGRGEEEADVEHRARGGLRGVLPHRVEHVDDGRAGEDERHHPERGASGPEGVDDAQRTDRAEDAGDRGRGHPRGGSSPRSSPWAARLAAGTSTPTRK